MVVPPPELQDGVCCLVEDQVHLFGHRFTVKGVPFITQDAQYLRCAHAAQWMVLRHANLHRGAPRRLPSEIHDASLGGTVNGRQVPSDGLSISQMLVGLTNLGLSPGTALLPSSREASEASDHLGLFATLCRYVNSQMPPIVISANHAWVIVGHTTDGPGSGHGSVVLYRHDDALGPYIPVPDPWKEPLVEIHEPWGLAIAPLPPKLYLSGERAEPIGQYALTTLGLQEGGVAFADRLARNRLSFRSYALTGSEFKGGVRGRVPDHVAEMYAYAHLPNFVWVVEVMDRDLVEAGQPAVLGEAVLDPTGYHQASPDHPLFDAVCMMSVMGCGVYMTPDHRTLTAVEGDTFSPYHSFHAPNRR